MRCSATVRVARLRSLFARATEAADAGEILGPGQACPNGPAPAKRTTPLVELVRLFANPLIAVLLVASIVSAAIGEWLNATIIVALVLLGAAINFIQTYHSHRAIEQLRKSASWQSTLSLQNRHDRMQVIADSQWRLCNGCRT
jgi:magnesium-transporting ATPase (P-type)